MPPIVTPLRTPGRAPRVLTIDAEEWFHVCGDEYYSDPRRWSGFAPRFERAFAELLDRIALGGHRATVFFLGWIAERYPDAVREARDRGHEIGLHGHLHRRADELSPEQFREDLLRGLERLDSASGVRPRVYRAAEWSIRSPEDPALSVLAEEGFRCDASLTSIPPLGRADNLPGPHRIELTEGALVEMPPLTGPGFGRRVPTGGGWAFRMFSAGRLAESEESYRSSGRPAVFTFHPWEFDPDHPPMDGLAPLLRLVHFWNLRSLPERFESWLERDRCETVGDALAQLEAA